MAPNPSKTRKIVDAAIAEFEERGFAGASMDRIAERAQVSKRTVYNHFESKNALFHAILDRMAEQALEAITTRFAPGLPIREQLLALGREEGQLLRTPEFLRLARMAAAETIRAPDLAAELARRMEHAHSFGRFFAEAAEAGALKTDDPARTADQFLGMIKAQAFWPAVMAGVAISSAQMDRIVTDSVEMILRAHG